MIPCCRHIPESKRRAETARGAARDTRGVTLVELMVVVAILAIITAIAMLALWQNVQQKARLAADQGTVAALRSAAAIYYGKHDGNFPPGKGLLNGLVNPSPPIFQCPGGGYNYDATNGRITLAVNDADLC